MGYFANPEAQSERRLDKWWNIIWNLKIPQKVRIFFWRACNEFFPSDLNLAKQHIGSNGSCFFCGNSDASTAHCLFFYPKAQEAWKGTHFWYLLKRCVCLDFLLCGLFMKDKLSLPEFELFVMNAWTIWKDLRSMKHNSKPSSTKISLEWAASFFDEFSEHVV